MPMSALTISLVQSDLVWENKTANLRHFASLLQQIPQESKVVVLPEMFQTGFSMQVQKLSETMDGETLTWLKEMAFTHKKIITGSLIMEENGNYYNRLIWMQPNGVYYYYDKRHLFAFAGEDKHFSSGNKKLIVSVNGWKICLQICYDLRFPVWARQDMQPENRYDLLIYVANWPQRRSIAWRTLLQARAIENQCYVAGVNRIGNDGNDFYHSGDSSLVDPLGNILWHCENDAQIFTYTLLKDDLTEIRNKFPFLNDGDKFILV